MSDFPPPPFEPGEPGPPPSLNVPLPPPLVGEGSPWAPADAENRDRILDWWRMWFRHVFFPWIAAFIAYWDAQWDRLAAYLNTWITAADAYIVEHAIAGLSFRTTATDIAGSGTTDVVFTGVDVEHRPLIIGDLVLDQSPDGNFGSITALIDGTHATVTFLGSLRGPIGLTGANGHGWWTTVTTIAHSGSTAVIITAGDRPVQMGDFVIDQSASAAYGEIAVVTDPTHVTVTFLGTLQGPSGGGGGGGIDSVVGSSTIDVDATDPANPVVSVNPAGLDFAPLPVDSTLSYINITGAYGWVDSSGTRGVILSINGVELGDAAGGSGITIAHDDAFGTPKIQLVGTKPLGLTVNTDVVGNLDPTASGGSIIYDSTLHALFFSNGTAWVKLADTIGAGVDSVTAGTGGITVDNTDPANPVVSYGGGSLPFAIPVYAGNITDLDPATYPDSMVYANDDSGNQWLFYSRTPGFWTAVNPTLVAGDGISIDNPGGDPGYTLVITNTAAVAGVVNGVTGGGSVIVEPETGIPNVSVPALDAPSIGHSIVMQNEAPVLGFGNGDAGMAFTSSGTDLTLFLSTGTGSPGVASVIISPTADPGRISFEAIDADSTTTEVTLDKGGLQWTLPNVGFSGLPGWTDEGLAAITDAIIPGSMIWSIDHGAIYARNSDDTGWLAVNTTPVV